MPESSDHRRSIPSVEKVLQALHSSTLPRPVLTKLAREELARFRSSESIPSADDVIQTIRLRVDAFSRSKIRRVINGTGVVLHTNLGRAPLSDRAVRAMVENAVHYNNLEYDLETGLRGGRASYLEHNLALLSGAEAATVVNNCAAALILVLKHFTRSRPEVIVSRGELVQIGGGFRIPEILEASGARLREVGTTNRTVAADYVPAINDATGLILRVHRGNFHMEGFVESPHVADLSKIAKQFHIPLVEDIGSGAVTNIHAASVMEDEPTPAEVLGEGADMVCFSGDKLLGGPQAGIIAGSRDAVSRLKQEPLYRALRCDKLILSALQATVDSHLERTDQNDPSQEELPVLRLIRTSVDELNRRGVELLEKLRDLPGELHLGTAQSQVGGGTLPKTRLPSVALGICPRAPLTLETLSLRLRQSDPAIVGYVEHNVFKIDLRTVFPSQDEDLVKSLRETMATDRAERISAKVQSKSGS